MCQPKPDWLKVKAQDSQNKAEVEKLVAKLSLHTVCEEANCPNMLECFSRRTATFMILGRVCTRNCTFCNVTKGPSQPVDAEEPENVAKAVKELNLRHAVITSVTRDDLEDGGAGHFARVIGEIKKRAPEVIIEVLIPDFKGDLDALKKVIEAKPHIMNHNIETVPELYPEVRPMAVFQRSLELLANVKGIDAGIYTKSGIMLGLGEQRDQVIHVFKELRKVGCDFLTVGQYLAPSKKHHAVIEYIHPDIFEEYRQEALKLGFKYVASSPLVRSSYFADKAIEEQA